MTGKERPAAAASSNPPGAFSKFFKDATGGRDPYPYQEYLSHCDIPDVLNVPTGAGKTEAAALSIWMWRRINHDAGVRAATPRRLIYCLPTRTLVEQTRNRISGFVQNLERVGVHGPAVTTLMGGDVDREYMKRPEMDTVIVGTQDMLLSRCLNRGYAASPFMWPVEFAVTNNDCMWVMDEVQLMDDGLATSVQVDAFRKTMGTFGPTRTVWMSATVDLKWLDTADAAGISRSALVLKVDSKGGHTRLFRKTLKGGKEESTAVEGCAADPGGDLVRRLTSSKPLRILKGPKKGEGVYTEAEAQKIWKVVRRGGSGGLTLIILNTVKRAQSLYRELKAIADGRGGDGRHVLLVHSRFRRADRNRIVREMTAMAGQGSGGVIVSTQVVEAGVDISAKLLITESAPWSSMIQRFGRCNREGKQADAEVCIIPMSPKAYAPYSKDDMERSAVMLADADGKSVSPGSLAPDSASKTYRTVIRKKDMMGLFDTSPDMSGGYTDVARYVRSVDETRDTHVFWRRWDAKGPIPKFEPRGDEVCAVPLHDLAVFAKSGAGRALYRYDHSDGSWRFVRQGEVRPGQTLLVSADHGGYTAESGWDPESRAAVSPIIEGDGGRGGDSVGDDPPSNAKNEVTLCDHAIHVERQMARIQQEMQYQEWPAEIMQEAAILHDVGKAHPVFQDAMRGGDQKKEEAVRDDGQKKEGVLLAKGVGSGRVGYRHQGTKRPFYFRHEAVSAVAILNKAGGDADLDTWLKAYVVAAHHGKVRMSMRNPPGKVKGGRYYRHDPRFVAGVPVEHPEAIPNFLSSARAPCCHDGSLDIQGWSDSKCLPIKSDIGRVGAPTGGTVSWLGIAQGLLRRYGPFRLALMEATLRSADMLASADEERQAHGPARHTKEGDD